MCDATRDVRFGPIVDIAIPIRSPRQRLRLACIGADAVTVAGQLGEALSGLVSGHWSVVDVTENLPLEHGCWPAVRIVLTQKSLWLAR